MKQLEAQGDRVSVGGGTHKSTVWAEGLVNSHILLGVDAAVSSQLVSLWQLSNTLLQVLHLGIHGINGLYEEWDKITWWKSHPYKQAQMQGYVPLWLIAKSYKESWCTAAHFFKGNRILCCSEILLESIKVLPESSTVNVRCLLLKAS